MIIYKVRNPSGAFRGTPLVHIPRHGRQFPNFFEQDILSDDEIISDTLKIIDTNNGLWEVDGKMVKKGAESFGQSCPIHKQSRQVCVPAHSSFQFSPVPTRPPKVKMPMRVKMREIMPLSSTLPTNFDSRRLRVACRRRLTRLNSRVWSSHPQEIEMNKLTVWRRVHESLGGEIQGGRKVGGRNQGIPN